MSGAAPAKMTLSGEQQKIVETWNQGMAVLAGAGSGKTTTLVQKCAALVERNPEARFAAVSFTDKSARDLRAKLAKDPRIQDLSRHWVMTIHGLCGAIIREHPREAGFDGEESILSEGEAALLWERATEALWFEEIPEEVQTSLESLLERETKNSVLGLLTRVRNLYGFGVLQSLHEKGDLDLFHVASYVMERYERLKRRRGALDFNDLELGAERVLRSPLARAEFRRRFDLILVDEFQDTNPLQASIIWSLIREDASNLCVVGDPKQSIYRFRDADVSVFEECCAKLPVRISLTKNFRSRPGVLDFTNAVCEPAFIRSDMNYEPLVPQRDPSSDFDPVLKLEVNDPRDLAAWIRAENEKGVPLSEMTLLLRKIRGNEKWLNALTAAGIPIAVESGGLFWEDPRVREMMSFLRWWDNPGNQLSGGIFLRAPWMGIDDQTLDRWHESDPTFFGPFFESGHPVAKALVKFRGREMFTRPAEVLLALLVDETREQELGSALLGLWHRMEELSMQRMDFHAVVTELSLAMRESRRDRTVPPPRNQGQLVVLTLHGSKGLEFPHVILLDFPEKPGRAQNAPLLFWDREKGAYFGGRDEDGERLSKDPVEVQWRQEEDRKNLAESKRLFYVALTRAKERLVLVFPNSPEKDVSESAAVPSPAPSAAPAKTSKAGTKEPKDPLDQDFWRGWIDKANLVVPTPAIPQAEM